MTRQVAPAYSTAANNAAFSPSPATTNTTTSTSTSQPALAPISFVSQPISRHIELPPQYRPRKQRKQVNVACQPCRKRRSKCTGTSPCSRCVTEGNECIFDGRKDAQERNRELRTNEKALSKVFRVLRKLDAGDSTSSSSSLSQIRKLARQNSDFQAFARELFDLDDKNISENETYEASEKQEDRSDTLSRNGRTPSTPALSAEERPTPSDTYFSESRHNSANPQTLQQQQQHHHHHTGAISGFGNLPFSSAIKANGYPMSIQHQQLNSLQYAEHSLLPLHIFENEALGRAYLSFKDAGLQMIANGVPVAEVLGPPEYINLDLYFKDRTPEDGHNVSTFVCEIMKNLANTDVSARLASIVLLAPMVRWVLFPTAENYARIPALMRPLRSQRFIPHSPALDLAPHPAIRESLMTGNANEWLDPDHQIIAAPVINWPYSLQETVYHDPLAGCIRFTKKFEDHVVDARNWTFFKRALKVFPKLREFGGVITDLGEGD